MQKGSGRKHRQYTDSFNQLKQMSQGQFEIAAHFNQKFASLEAQNELLYNALVKIADKFEIDLSEPEPEMPVETSGVITGDDAVAASEATPAAGEIIPVNVGPDEPITASAIAEVIQQGEDLSGKSDA
jgi:hypothetical protein